MDMYFFQNETLNGIMQSGSGNGRTGSDPMTATDGLTDSQQDQITQILPSEPAKQITV